MKKLDNFLDQLEAKIPHHEKLHEGISKANVAWHIEHSLLTLDRITNALIQSNPNDYKWTFNIARLFVFATKKIPRGRAKAPKSVQPKEGSISADQLLKHVADTRNKCAALYTISKDQYFDHPFFGNLKLKQAIKVLEIHTQHHLNIIEDIIKK